MDKVIPPSELRAYLEADYLRRPIPESVWRELDAAERLRVDDSFDGLNRLAEEVEDRLSVAPDPVEVLEPADARQLAISRLVVEHARADKTIREFRDTVLGGPFIKETDVGKWVQKHAGSDGSPTVWLSNIPSPHDHTRRQSKDGLIYTDPPLKLDERHGAHTTGLKLLRYQVPDKDREQLQPTASNGVLDRLRLVAERAATRYGWTPAQAATFVLTDVPPVIRDFAVTVTLTQPFTGLSRIDMSINPAMTPTQVAERYKEVRDRMGGVGRRSLSTKHLELAAFFAERPEGESWAVRLEAWNDKHPRWIYSHKSNFTRDCVEAAKRLLFPDYEWRAANDGSKER